jgi:hypothetical protein
LLNFKSKLFKYSIDSTKDVEVDIGDNFEFDCKAQGYPKPNISWIRAESKPLHDGLAKFNVFRFNSEFIFVIINQMKEINLGRCFAN